MKLKKALLINDVQNDFCPGGALAVPGADKIIPNINRYIKFFARKKLPIFATRDWHPAKTRHFKNFGGRWPVHCIQNTAGAAFCPKLRLPEEAILLYKGMDPRQDSYSAFQAKDLSGMSLINLLKLQGIGELYIGGLTTDYCVKFSALDALRHGFKVKILLDAIQGVNLHPNDSKEAIRKMLKKGARKINLAKLNEKNRPS